MRKLIFASLLTMAGAYAQTILTPTTLSTAVSDSSGKQIILASATNAVTGNVVYIDHELMDIQVGDGSNKTITVRRGAAGTHAAPHISGANAFVGTPSQFFQRSAAQEKQGSCTRANELVLPYINVLTGVISDCLGGVWVNGVNNPLPKFRIYAPEPGGTAYTSLNTNGTTVGATTLYCTEVNLPANKLLTGIAILNGTTVGTDKQYVVLYDAAGKALANSALAGAVTANASTYQTRAFTSKFFAVGPAQYFACFQSDTGTDTVRMAITGVNDNILTKGQTGATFGTVPALTVPTTFTTAVGPYVALY
jgi:hypothetical protein